MARPGDGSWNGNVMSAFSARRRILSLWLPRLPIDRIRRELCFSGARVEQSSNVNGVLPPPQAGEVKKEAPSVVVIKENNALQIYALDDAAARQNLAIGMPLANARAICPHLVVHDADEAADARTLDAIADWCDRFTPLVALDAPHGLFLDITGCAHLFGGEAAILRLLCDALTVQGFAVSAAIASTAICARTMTRHIHGRIVPDGEEADAVSTLPVAAL